MKNVIVLGASTNIERYSNKAIKLLRAYGYPVIGIGLKEGTVADVDIQTDLPKAENIDTVTMYVGQKNQALYSDYILNLKPKRVIFNPGAENTELENLLLKNNIEVENACTLVLLSTGQF